MIWILVLMVLAVAAWPCRTSRVHVEIRGSRCQERSASPPRAARPQRRRPTMIYSLAHRCWRCPCGGSETEHARAARPPVEHACPLETWS